MTDRPRTLAEMLDDPTRDCIILHCLDAWRDANGQPGQHKVPLEGYDTPMTFAEARAALTELEAARPGEDFSIGRIRRLAGVVPFPR